MPNTPRMNWPYPTENQKSWYEAFKVFVEAMDSSGYAGREDRQLVLTGGGTVIWDAVGSTLSWDDLIRIASPISGFQVQSAAATITITAGQFLYLSLTRSPTKNVVAIPAVGSQVPSTDEALLLAVRIGDNLYWRNGLMMNSGDSLTDIGASQGSALEIREEGASVDAAVVNIDFVGAGATATQTAAGYVKVDIPGGGTDLDAIHDNVAAEINAISAKGTPIGADKLLIEDSEDGTAWTKKSILISTLPVAITTDVRTAVIVVGNSANGDSVEVCDYLDIGDGVQLAAALAASGVGADVYIRPGTYDLGVGAAVAPLIVPVSVRVRGAGRSHTKVTTKTLGDQGAFTLGADSILEDVGVDAALPTASGSGSISVVLLNGARARCRRVAVDFPGVWTSTQAGYTALRAVFEVGVATVSSPADCLLDDCWAGQHNAVPALRDLGLGAGNEMACFAMRTIAAPTWFSTQLIKAQSNGGDWAVAAQARAKIMLSMFYDMFLRGVVLLDDAGGSEVGGNHIFPVGSAGTEIGILLDTVGQCGVHDNYVECSTPTAGQYAISLVAADYNTLTANCGPGGLVGAVSLDASSGDNIVTTNQFSGASYNDLGALNDVAHNK